MITHDNLYDYLEDNLSGDEQLEFEQHLESCPSCREELRVARRLDDLLMDMPEPELPAGFLERLHSRLDEVDQARVSHVNGKLSVSSPTLFQPAQVRKLGVQRQHWMRPLLLAASVILLVGGMWWSLSPGPTPPQSGPVAILAAAQGPVKVGGQEVVKTQVLSVGTTLNTEKEAGIVTVGAARNQVRCGPETRLTVQSVEAGEGGSKVQAEFKLEQGKVWITEASAQVAIRTDNALIMPLGTDYEVVREGSDQVRVTVWDGQVQVRHQSGRNELVGPGQELSYGRSSVGEPGGIAPERSQEAWHNWNSRVKLDSNPNPQTALTAPPLQAAAPTVAITPALPGPGNVAPAALAPQGPAAGLGPVQAGQGPGTSDPVLGPQGPQGPGPVPVGPIFQGSGPGAAHPAAQVVGQPGNPAGGTHILRPSLPVGAPYPQAHSHLPAGFQPIQPGAMGQRSGQNPTGPNVSAPPPGRSLVGLPGTGQGWHSVQPGTAGLNNRPGQQGRYQWGPSSQGTPGAGRPNRWQNQGEGGQGNGNGHPGINWNRPGQLGTGGGGLRTPGQHPFEGRSPGLRRSPGGRHPIH